ncbi:MAG: hypothetical protein WKF83_12850 [Nocardioidaceae bacterium]
MGTSTSRPAGTAPSVRGQLLELPGIGAWTADYVLMRALADPDVYLDTDLVVRRAARRRRGRHRLCHLDGGHGARTP